MKSKKNGPPDLGSCVRILQSLSKDLHSKPPKIIGELYVAALGLIYHLKLDRTKLENIKKLKQAEGKPSAPFPRSNEIPAISSVVHNQVLFRALVSCLSSTAADMESESSSRSLPTPGNPTSRKRTLSMSGDIMQDTMTPKSMKISHSPQVGKRTFSYGKPQMNVKVLAATILYISFEPLDHWPVPIIKAYAEDCFGPRSWVDDPACQLFVRNLALSHISDSHDSVDAKRETDALAVADFFHVKEPPPQQQQKAAMASSSVSPVRQQRYGRGSLGGLSTGGISSHTSMTGAPPLTRPRSMSIDSFDSTKKPDLPKNVTSEGSRAASVGTRNGGGNDSDSGEEEEEEIKVTSATNKEDDGSSSSSGEEDEEVVVGTKKSFDDESSTTTSPNPAGRVESTTDSSPGFKPTYPYTQEYFNFDEVRQRYFGINLDHAHVAISTSLNERLDMKSKQNSGLLQTLPNFTAVPEVRSLITANLEKWLQSPALAGLGRSLFSTTVGMMKNVDPPLPADLEAIDNILGMKLKVNQFNAHVENVTAIAKRIPTSAVSNHIFSHLLRELALSIDSPDSSSSDLLKMINAVYNELPDRLAPAGIAAALLSLLEKKPASLNEISTPRVVRRLLLIVRSISKELGGAFDSCLLLTALRENTARPNSWTVTDEENKARLMFQCVTLLVDKSFHLSNHRKSHLQASKRVDSPLEGSQSMKRDLMKAKKMLLGWCCTEYAPLCSENADSNANGKHNGNDSNMVGAGTPNYGSILDGLESSICLPRWLETMRCVLFLEGPQSPCLHRFLFPAGDSPSDDADWQKETSRISRCCELGADVDDEMVSIVLKAGNGKTVMPAAMALQLLEHTFHGCCKINKSSLHIQDPSLLNELYDLVEYFPTHHALTKDDNSGLESNAGSKSQEKDSLSFSNGSKKKISTRLAYPGMWWRATSLALIMCGASPDCVGLVAWNEFPTLRALMKMVTSDRYRFPTVDCDDASRDEMKKTEQAMRDEEAKITELLFLPKKPKKKKKEKHTAEVSHGGSRASLRQQEKRERMLQKQKEQERAEAQAEAHRRKKLLRAAQKSIMLWDPRKGARKPPRESADLIFAVGESFDLPKTFQRSTKPDLLLMTIGNTTRGAIERAYDWLIPIISVFPDTIARLPASASCFLLLRAYGTEGEERSQLQNLASPLLDHVRNSLMGKFGEADAIRAFDLLLSDVASHNADRRRCGRRVLHDAIGRCTMDNHDEVFADSNCSWMVNILNMEHCTSILSKSIDYLTRAASFERGRTLRFVVLALERLTKAAVNRDVPGKWEFSAMLVELISSRPTVFAGTMSSFPDLRELAICLVHGEFKKRIETMHAIEADSGSEVEILICDVDKSEGAPTVLPLPLLQCACVLLSIWSGDDNGSGNDRSEAVNELVRMLMKPQGTDQDDDSKTKTKSSGLASARFAGSGKSAIPVESWVMLARSRSDFIAKRAALTAPTGFLPRLLLCSGLPRASLLTMVDRLGKLGDKTPDQGKVFNQLLIPSAASEWDIGRLGHRREVSRKLLGRLSAYIRMYNLSDEDGDEIVSFTFLNWLTESCKSSEKPRKSKSKKAKSTSSALLSIGGVGSILEACTINPLKSKTESEDLLQGDASEMTDFLSNPRDGTNRPYYGQVKSTDEIENFLKSAFGNNEVMKVQSWIEESVFQAPDLRKRKRKVPNEEKEGNSPMHTVAFLLLKSFSELERKTEGLGSCILTWVPKLSSSSGSPDLWKAIFAEGQKPGFMWSNLISRCVQSWSAEHVSNCRLWLLSSSEYNEASELSSSNVVFFLAHATSLFSIHHRSLLDAAAIGHDDAWMESDKYVIAAAKLAIDCLKSVDEADVLKVRVCSRNCLPDSVSLVLSIAKYGKKQLQWLCQTIVESMDKSEDAFRCILLAVILRLYAYCPQSMNLGVAVLRSVLIEAVDKYAMVWLDWRSPLDDQFKDMVDAVISNGAPQRLVTALAEGSKRHPLLLLRQLGCMQQALEADASVSGETRGVISGQNLSGPLTAKVDEKLIKVTIQHWGFNYTENKWVSLLEIIAAVPKEVLFGCGLKMGLLDLLGVYLRLMFVQSQLRTNEKIPRLKNKLSEFFGALKNASNKGWEDWLASSISGLSSLGTTRNVLMSCDFISHQQAIDSVKKAKETSINGAQARQQ